MSNLGLVRDKVYNEQIIGGTSAAMGRASVRQNLEMRREALKNQLADVEQAISALDENPGFEKALEAIQKVI